MSPHVAMRGIVKRFSPAVLANDRIDLDLARGEIVALLGENGAGKSTLMQILYGLHRRDEGTITVGGRPFEPASPADAMAAGIGMIHQEFMLVAPFTVAENLAMGRGDAGPFDLAATAGRIVDLARLHGLDVDPHALVEHLPIGVRQRVEILKRSIAGRRS